MSTRMFHRANMRARRAEDIQNDIHYRAAAGAHRTDIYEVDEVVYIKKTGEKRKILEKTRWGDYILEGYPDKYFSGRLLERKHN